jgi:hypothetical protein
MEKIIIWICRIIVLFGFGYNLISNGMSTQDKLFMILFIVSGLLIGYIGYKRGYNDANKNINGDTSRKDPRNEDA